MIRLKKIQVSELMTVAMILICAALLLPTRNTLSWLPVYPHFSIPGLEFFADPTVLFLTGWSGLLVLAISACRRKFKLDLVLAGSLMLAYAVGTSEVRHAMVFFPPFVLIAYGLMNTFNIRSALVVTVASVYLASAFHRAFHFNTMVAFVPAAMPVEALKAWTSSSSTMFIPVFMAWSVVVAEFSMGTFFLFAKTRSFVFLLIVFFHLMIGLLTDPEVRVAGASAFVLLAHALIASSERRLTLGELFSIPLARIAIAMSMVAFVVANFSALPTYPQHFLLTFSKLAPLVAISIAAYFLLPANSAPLSTFLESRRGPSRIVLASLMVLLTSWGLLPVFVGHTNDHLGWAMFSSGSQATPWHCFEHEPSGRSCYGKVSPLFAVSKIGDESRLRLCSRQLSNLDRMRAYLETNCKTAQPLSSIAILPRDQISQSMQGAQ